MIQVYLLYFFIFSFSFPFSDRSFSLYSNPLSPNIRIEISLFFAENSWKCLKICKLWFIRAMTNWIPNIDDTYINLTNFRCKLNKSLKAIGCNIDLKIRMLHTHGHTDILEHNYEDAMFFLLLLLKEYSFLNWYAYIHHF